MNGSNALASLRRRWWIVVLLTVAGGVAGALPEPEQVNELDRTFVATHTLLLNQPDQFSPSSFVNPGQLTLFATTGEVPARAAEALEFSGNPASLASEVTSLYDFETSALTISTTGASAERVEIVADTFADELASYLAERQDFLYQERLAAALERLSDAEAELTEVTTQLAADPEDPILTAQQSAISRQYSVAFEQSEELSATPPVLGLTTLERAQAVETTDRGITAPQSRQSRAVLGAIVGMAVGVGIALLLGVLDRRIRSREQAEEALDLRARVLIPKVKDADRDQLVVRADRHDALSDSYRTVRNVVSFVHGPIEERERAPITLVVSPTAGDGKTSLAVNLAAAAAEAGRRTVLVNCDFRRPRLSKVFGPAAERPLPFMYEDVEALSGRTLLNRTGLARLRLLDLSSVNAPAGDLVRASAQKLDELTALSDHVVIDTSPIGATAEVLDLVPHADAIVMVVRVGNGTITQAKRAIAILRDLTEVPILLVLGGLKQEKAEYYEYSDRRRAERGSVDGRSGRSWFRRKGRGADSAPELEAGSDSTGEQDRLFDYEPVE